MDDVRVRIVAIATHLVVRTRVRGTFVDVDLTQRPSKTQRTHAGVIVDPGLITCASVKARMTVTLMNVNVAVCSCVS